MAAMEEQFLWEQATYRHNPEFLKNVATNEMSNIFLRVSDRSHPWNPISDDQNDANLGAVTNDPKSFFL